MPKEDWIDRYAHVPRPADETLRQAVREVGAAWQAQVEALAHRFLIPEDPRRRAEFAEVCEHALAEAVAVGGTEDEVASRAWRLVRLYGLSRPAGLPHEPSREDWHAALQAYRAAYRDRVPRDA